MSYDEFVKLSDDVFAILISLNILDHFEVDLVETCAFNQHYDKIQWVNDTHASGPRRARTQCLEKC